MSEKRLPFKLHAPFPPAGDQKQAITALVEGRPGKSTLLGVTGSGKTYTVANVIAQQNKPVLVLAPNKTLAAQLYEEFSQFFPENKVCYFVSYYDYYQPESYVPARDMYIAKEAKVNSEVERLRVEATASLLTRKDTIIIASVSCIYSLGNPDDYRILSLPLSVGHKISLPLLIQKLTGIHYRLSDFERSAGTMQRLDNALEVTLPYTKDRLRITIEDEAISKLELLKKLDDTVVATPDTILIFPARHFVATDEKKQRALQSIRQELDQWLPKLSNPLYQERIANRVERDLESLERHGYCPGVENYSIHFDTRPWGSAPHSLFDFFKDFILIIDESHLMIPQLQGMYAGDRIRKKNLIDFGFRLPSAYDNRPLMFEETEKYFNDTIFISATPGKYELEQSDQIVEQIIRPTGLVDPIVEIHGRRGQLENLVAEIATTRERGYRSLVTVLTKKLAEELALYLEQKQIKVCYIHSDLKTPQRTEVLHKLRAGIFDCIVGVNLLREGLDLPEVALVAIMDADVEGFLRDKRSLIQTIGRAARNVDAKVILYADTVTPSIRDALDETERRRLLQQSHNDKEGITPQTVVREVTRSISPIQKLIEQASNKKPVRKRALLGMTEAELDQKIAAVEAAMHEAAQRHDYNAAIQARDEWFILKRRRDELATQPVVAPTTYTQERSL